jgi:hypothetical protein
MLRLSTTVFFFFLLAASTFAINLKSQTNLQAGSCTVTVYDDDGAFAVDNIVRSCQLTNGQCDIVVDLPWDLEGDVEKVEITKGNCTCNYTYKIASQLNTAWRTQGGQLTLNVPNDKIRRILHVKQITFECESV